MSTTLYVSILPLSATEELLAGKFGKVGAVVSVKLKGGAVIGASRRGAFVQMRTAADAKQAINGLYLADYDGRLMSVRRGSGGRSLSRAVAGSPSRAR